MAVQGATHVKGGIIKAYCVKRGFIEKEEDYEDLLRRAREHVHFPPYPAVQDVVAVVTEASGRIAIAHPYRYFNGADRARMDMLREECSLSGIECAHPSVPADHTPVYRKYCEEHNLFSTGGSDCHTNGDAQTLFGRHGGLSGLCGVPLSDPGALAVHA